MLAKPAWRFFLFRPFLGPVNHFSDLPRKEPESRHQGLGLTEIQPEIVPSLSHIPRNCQITPRK
jgi:hypothetical protein